MYEPGDIVDLFDVTLQQWRGKYIVMLKKAVTPLIKIKNMATNREQFVPTTRLRRGRLSQFFIKGLQSKP